MSEDVPSMADIVTELARSFDDSSMARWLLMAHPYLPDCRSPICACDSTQGRRLVLEMARRCSSQSAGDAS